MRTSRLEDTIAKAVANELPAFQVFKYFDTERTGRIAYSQFFAAMTRLNFVGVQVTTTSTLSIVVLPVRETGRERVGHAPRVQFQTGRIPTRTHLALASEPDGHPYRLDFPRGCRTLFQAKKGDRVLLR